MPVKHVRSQAFTRAGSQGGSCALAITTPRLRAGQASRPSNRTVVSCFEVIGSFSLQSLIHAIVPPARRFSDGKEPAQSGRRSPRGWAVPVRASFLRRGGRRDQTR